MVLEHVIDEYLEAGKRLTPLKGKDPFLKDWPKRKIKDDKIKAHTDNIGWVLGKYDFVIDVDVKNGDGLSSFQKLVDHIQQEEGLPPLFLQPTVITPSGGFHVYLKIPDHFVGVKLRKRLERDFPSIDFLTKGSQVVIPTSSTDAGEYRWADEDFGCFEQSTCPESILKLCQYESAGNDSDDELGDFEGLLGGSSHWPKKKVLKLLSSLNPSMGHDEWVKVGMALHDWNPTEEGLQVWEGWSVKGDNYTEGETEKRWRSFRAGNGVTFGSITYMAKDADFDRLADRVGLHLQSIGKADLKKLKFDVIPDIQKDELDVINRETIVKALQDRLKELTGVKIPVGEARSMVNGSQVARGHFIEEGEAPEWCNGWVYVNSHTGFMNLDTLRLHKTESFNVENGKHIPLSEGGSKPSASKFISDNGFIRKVDSIAYLPTLKETIVNLEGTTILNTFNPNTVPQEADDFTEAGKDAIERVKKHVRFICGNDRDAEIFLQWLAHQVQYPGKQILWSPIIQSIEGVGKSFFAELLRGCLGDRNVGTVSPAQVTSDFNGWASGVCVNVLEELRVKGHNRFDAVNALKPLITDRMIQINDKGIKQFMTYNTANYICFTNFKDSLPLNGTDRRWWVVFVPIQSLDNLSDYVGEGAGTYFPTLFEAVRSNGSELRKWLLEYPITDEFLNTKQAPMTDHKLSMIATEEASFEGLSELRDMIKKGGKYFNEDCISSGDLFNSFLFEHSEIDLNTRTKNTILKMLGYTLNPKPIKIDGKTRRVWTRKPMSNSEIRDSFVHLDL